MEYQAFIHALYEKLEFKKPNVSSKILKVESDCIYYSIGESGKSKKVTFEEFRGAFNELERKNEITRNWFNDALPKQAKSAPCSFTTIGGLMQHFGLVSYKRGAYTKIEKKILERL